MLKMEVNEIISATEVVKNFSAYRNKVKKVSRLFIFKNNKPDLALLDINLYEDMITEIETLKQELENLEIRRIIEQRNKVDNGKRYTKEQAMARLRNKS